MTTRPPPRLHAHRARLRPHRNALLEQLRNFGRVRQEYVADVAALLEHALQEHPNKAAAAARVSQARARNIEAGIRHAIGAAPLSQRGLAGAIQRRIARKGPAFYGLKRVPCIYVIRRVLRTMLPGATRKESEYFDNRHALLVLKCGRSLRALT